MVPWKALHGQNITTAKFSKQEERRRWRMAEEGMWEKAERAFQAYDKSVVTVTSFKYLGWVFTAAYDYWKVVVGNLWEAHKLFSLMSRILRREGARPRFSGMFFKAVVQAVLLFW